METESQTTALRMYVNDMVALEKHILEAIERQKNDANVAAMAGASKLITNIHRVLAEHVTIMENHAAALGGKGGAIIKETVSAVAGVVAGLYDKIRKDPVSRMLRDDYTALNLAAISYGMLHTTGLAFREMAIANIALKHLKDLTPLVIELNETVAGVVAQELMDEGGVDASAGATATSNIQQAWSHDVVK